jgi:hypothetical protein
MLKEVSSSFAEDIQKSNAESPLDSILSLLWDKFGGRNGPLPVSSSRAMKVLLYGLFRLLSRR